MHMILTKLLLPVKTNIERYATCQSYGIKSQEIQGGCQHFFSSYRTGFPHQKLLATEVYVLKGKDVL